MTEPSDTPTLAERFAAALERVEERKAALREAEAERDRLEEELAARLEASGADSLEHGRFVFAPRRMVQWRVIADDREQVVRLCRAGAPELVKETVNAASLAGFLRREERRLEREAPSWWGELRPLLERSETLSLSVRRRPTG
jgi:hypothetical protein